MSQKDMDWQFAQSFGTEESEEHGFCEGLCRVISAALH